ncbi:MAG TPA: hypothetical protein VK453_01420 [Micromonosporaceae bacterium]|nr:hypothetical protein [Micromonosporaceae bacterium]
MAPLARRLASPAGLIMAGLCLLLPFISASCASEERPRLQWRVTYTGVDVIAGGEPEVAFTGDADREPIHRLDDVEIKQVLGKPPAPLPPQPLAWLSAALLAAALAATALPSRTWRTTATAGLALAAAVVLCGATMLARQDATDAAAAVLSQVTAQPSTSPPTVPQLRHWEHYGQVSDKFRYMYGFWTAIAALSIVGVSNTVGMVLNPAYRRDRTVPDAEKS